MCDVLVYNEEEELRSTFDNFQISAVIQTIMMEMTHHSPPNPLSIKNYVFTEIINDTTKQNNHELFTCILLRT